ncbi:DNA-3-methyladenine glycosylase [Bradyrhizobium japonicum]
MDISNEVVRVPHDPKDRDLKIKNSGVCVTTRSILTFRRILEAQASATFQAKGILMIEYFGRKYVEVDANFFAPPAAKVAPKLIGCVLHHDNRGAETAIILIDVEAYGGGNDRASHFHPENRSLRNKAAKNLTPPGTARIHGSRNMWGLDIVCGEEGQGSTVLIRAGLPVLGIEIMAERRSQADAADRVVKERARGYERRLSNAPFNLGEAMGLSPVLDGASLLGHPFRLHRPVNPVSGLLIGRRVRVTQDVDRLWRWGHPDHQAWLRDKFKNVSE